MIVRYKHIVSVSASERVNVVGCEGTADAPCCATLEAAVAPAWEVTLLFAVCENAVGVLQRSRNAVHLRRGMPIVGIAWSHSLARLEFLRVGCWSVDTGHGHRCLCGEAGRFSKARTGVRAKTRGEQVSYSAARRIFTQSGGWNKHYMPRQHAFAFYLQSVPHNVRSSQSKDHCTCWTWMHMVQRVHRIIPHSLWQRRRAQLYSCYIIRRET